MAPTIKMIVILNVVGSEFAETSVIRFGNSLQGKLKIITIIIEYTLAQTCFFVNTGKISDVMKNVKRK